MSLFNVINSKKEILVETLLPFNEKIYLRLESENGKLFRFYLSDSRREWKPVKNFNDKSVFEGSFIPRWGSGLRAGLMVEGKKGESGIFNFTEVKYSY